MDTFFYDSFGVASLKKALFGVTVLPPSTSGSANCFQEGCTPFVGRPGTYQTAPITAL